MDNPSWQLSNPWVDDDASLGTVRNILAIAYRTGHVDRGDLDTEVYVEHAKENCASMKLIELMKRVQENRKAIDKANLGIQKRLQDKETSDITHIDVAEKKIKQITSLNNHLQQIISNKDQLISRLQQPYVGDFLKIEASYHKYASEFFPQVAPILSELTSHLENIEWSSTVDMNDGYQEQVLAELTSNLAALQTRFQLLTQLRQAVQQRHQDLHLS